MRAETHVSLKKSLKLSVINGNSSESINLIETSSYKIFWELFHCFSNVADLKMVQTATVTDALQGCRWVCSEADLFEKNEEGLLKWEN
jgi:hypothetical protein